MTTTDMRADALHILDTDPAVNAVAFWTCTDDLSTVIWPMATVDNRRSRVLARIDRIGHDIDTDTLTIIRR